jgi:GT2 family glycosyltransferase
MRWPGPSSPPPAPVSRTQFTASDLLILNRFQTSTVLMRTDTVRAVGGFDARLDGAEDWDMWLRMAKRGEIVKLDWPYVTYRDVASGYSNDLSRVYRTMCLMLDRECAESTLPAAHVGAVVAWHHLRFVVGFLLLKDFAGARLALGGLGRHRVRRYAPTAATRFLLPFLAGRVARRLPRRRR